MLTRQVEFLRRNASRGRRRWLESRGDWSRSQPSRPEVAGLLAPNLDFDDGVFVEAGAHDGFFQSNTYWLERHRGWHGILIEPVPKLAAQARRARPRSRVFNCALVSDAFTGSEVTMHYAGPLSIVAGSQGAWNWAQSARKFNLDRGPYDFTVPARTLTSVLEESGVRAIDFLSLDVEGYEAQVLQGVDLTRFTPRLVLVEVVGEGGDHRAEVEAALGSAYKRLGETSVDVLYRLSTPPTPPQEA